MGSTAWMIWFLATLVAFHVIIYGGITAVYFRDKHRSVPAAPRTAVPPQARELDDAEDRHELPRAA